MEFDTHASAPTKALYVNEIARLDGQTAIDWSVPNVLVPPDGNCFYIAVHRWYFAFKDAYPQTWERMHKRLKDHVRKNYHDQSASDEVKDRGVPTDVRGIGERALSVGEKAEIEKWRAIIAQFWEEKWPLLTANVTFDGSSANLGLDVDFATLRNWYDWQALRSDYYYFTPEIQKAMAVKLQQGNKRANWAKPPRVEKLWREAEKAGADAAQANKNLSRKDLGELAQYTERALRDRKLMEMRGKEEEGQQAAQDAAIEAGGWNEGQVKNYALASMRTMGVWAFGFEREAISEILGIFVYNWQFTSGNEWSDAMLYRTSGPDYGDRDALATYYDAGGDIPRMNLVQSTKHFTFQRPGKKSYDRASLLQREQFDPFTGAAVTNAPPVAPPQGQGTSDLVSREGDPLPIWERQRLAALPDPQNTSVPDGISPQERIKLLQDLRRERERKKREAERLAAGVTEAAPPSNPMKGVVPKGVPQSHNQQKGYANDRGGYDRDGDGNVYKTRGRVPYYDNDTEEAYNYTADFFTDEQIRFCQAKLKLAHESFIKHVANRKNYGKIMLMDGRLPDADARPASSVFSARQKQDNLAKAAEVMSLWAEIERANRLLTKKLWQEWSSKYAKALERGLQKSRSGSFISQASSEYELKMILSLFSSLPGLRPADMADFWYELCVWWKGFKGDLKQPWGTESGDAAKLRLGIQDWYTKERGKFRRLVATVNTFWNFMDTIRPIVEREAGDKKSPYANKIKNERQKPVDEAIEHLEKISLGTEDDARERDRTSLEQFVRYADQLLAELRKLDYPSQDLELYLKASRALLQKVTPLPSAQELYQQRMDIVKQIEEDLRTWHRLHYDTEDATTQSTYDEQLNELLILAQYVRDRWQESVDKEKTDVFKRLDELVESTIGFLQGDRSSQSAVIDTIRFLFQLYMAQREAFVAFYGEDDEDGTILANVKQLAKAMHQINAPKLQAREQERDALDRLSMAEHGIAQANANKAAVERRSATAATKQKPKAKDNQAAEAEAAAAVRQAQEEIDAALEAAERAKDEREKAEREAAAGVEAQQLAREKSVAENAAKKQRDKEELQRQQEKEAREEAERIALEKRQERLQSQEGQEGQEEQEAQEGQAQEAQDPAPMDLDPGADVPPE